MPEDIEYAPDCENVEDSKLKLPEKAIAAVETKTGEEEEDVVFHERSRLFLFFEEDKYGDEVRKNIWKERGTGEVRILKHKTEKTERIVMRQEKTLKLILNHVINPMTILKDNPGSDRSWCFFCEDFADGEVKKGFYAIRFRDHECAMNFKKAFDEARKNNAEWVRAGAVICRHFHIKVDMETGELLSKPEEPAAEAAAEPEAKKE